MPSTLEGISFEPVKTLLTNPLLQMLSWRNIPVYSNYGLGMRNT